MSCGWLLAFKLDSFATEIRNYYGEQIAMYFCFISFYCKWLIPAAVIGAIFCIYQGACNEWDAPWMPIYGVFISGWATLILKYWKRKEAQLQVIWGMTRSLDQEIVRPEFKGKWEISVIDGRRQEVPVWKIQLKKAFLSWSLIVMYISLVLTAGIFMFILRKLLVALKYSFQNVMIISSVISFAQIQLFNFIYGYLAPGLTSYENHRLESQNENSLIGKSFLFRFINTFISVFYIAYFKREDSASGYCAGSYSLSLHSLTKMEADIVSSWTNSTSSGIVFDPTWSSELQATYNIYTSEGSDYRGDCVGEMWVQISIVFALMITVNNVVEFYSPVIKDWMSKRRSAKAVSTEAGVEPSLTEAEPSEAEPSDAEIEYYKGQYDGPFSDFDELVVQFGFVVLFFVCPLAPILALAANIVEVKLDASKLLRVLRRPQPRNASNIGTWYGILNILTWLSLVTNTTIAIFTTKTFQKYDLESKLVLFIIVEHILVALKIAVSYMLPKAENQVDRHLARQTYLTSALVKIRS